MKEEPNMSFLNKLQIDKRNLAKEWQVASSEFFELRNRQDVLTMERDTLKDQFEIVKAEVYIKIKTEPSTFGITDSKPTESYISAVITCTEAVKELSKNIIQKQYELSVVKSAITAFECKVKALDNLTKMYIAKLESTQHNQKEGNLKALPIRRKK